MLCESICTNIVYACLFKFNLNFFCAILSYQHHHHQLQHTHTYFYSQSNILCYINICMCVRERVCESAYIHTLTHIHLLKCYFCQQKVVATPVPFWSFECSLSQRVVKGQSICPVVSTLCGIYTNIEYRRSNKT